MEPFTLSDIANFRYEHKDTLVQVEGYLYMCNHKLNEVLRIEEGLLANAPVFYAVLMHNKSVEEGPSDPSQRNIHFRFDTAKVIFCINAINGAPKDKNGAYKYNCLFFSNAHFFYPEGGYPAMEEWLADSTNELTINRRSFNEWSAYSEDGSEFLSTRDHSTKFYNC